MGGDRPNGIRRAIENGVKCIEHGNLLADLLLIDGDPLADIEILTKPEKNLVVIMKDGKIYKNTLK